MPIVDASGSPWGRTKDSGYGDFKWWNGIALSEETYAHLAERLYRWIEAEAEGRAVDYGELDQLRGELRLPEDVRPCLDPPSTESRPLTNAELLKLTLDTATTMGMDSGEWLFGPWFWSLTMSNPWHRNALQMAVAAASLWVQSERLRTPVRAWLRTQPRPEAAHRARVHCIQRAPWMFWRLEAAGEQWRLHPLYEVQGWWVPDTPVDLAGVGSVDGPVVGGGLLMARVFPAQGEWHVRTGLSLPQCPEPERLRKWWRVQQTLMQVNNRSLRTEDILRHRADALVREAHRWWWGIKASRRA